MEDSTEGLIKQATIDGKWVAKRYCDNKPTEVVRVTGNSVRQWGLAEHSRLDKVLLDNA